MDPLSPLPAVACLLAAFVVGWAISRVSDTGGQSGRYATIDGLRGYLALGVFLHHSSIWYFYLKTGRWEAPQSNLYNHFGQSGVALFFMVTGFLFFSKLINRDVPVDWLRLYVSRLLRLVPLYFLALLVFFVVVFAVSGFEFRQPWLELVGGVTRWLAFTVAGAPDLNLVERSWIILAGVTWSLPYEWFFYFVLPVLGVFVGRKPTVASIVCCGLMIYTMLQFWRPETIHLKSFLGGIAAAILYRSEKFRHFSSSKVATFVLIGCAAVSIGRFPSAYSTTPLLLLSVAFVLLACGNTLFGLLTRPASIVLGEIAYGIYLVHGLLLFCTFHFLIGIPAAREFDPFLHWGVILLLTPLLVAVCYFLFRVVELPAMEKVDWASAVFRKGLRKCSFRRAGLQN